MLYYEGISGTEDFFEARGRRGRGWQALFVDEELQDALQRVDASLLRVAFWRQDEGPWVPWRGEVVLELGGAEGEEFCCRLGDCDKKYKTWRQLVVHQMRSSLPAHGVAHPVHTCVINNTCPVCRSTFADRVSATHHLAAA